MPIAKSCEAATLRVESRITILAKLLAGAIIFTPLVMMLFPELSRCGENNASQKRQITPAVQAKAAGPALVPFGVKRCD